MSRMLLSEYNETAFYLRFTYSNQFLFIKETCYYKNLYRQYVVQKVKKIPSTLPQLSQG